jgi:hypothetical protein
VRRLDESWRWWVVLWRQLRPPVRLPLDVLIGDAHGVEVAQRRLHDARRGRRAGFKCLAPVPWRNHRATHVDEAPLKRGGGGRSARDNGEVELKKKWTGQVLLRRALALRSVRVPQVWEQAPSADVTDVSGGVRAILEHLGLPWWPAERVSAQLAGW